MTHILKFPTRDAAMDALARHLVADIGQVLDRKNYYRLALAGGDTPRLLYQRLAQPDIADALDWSRLRIYWSDERCVPPDDPQSNYRMAREALLDHVPIRAGNTYPMDGTIDPDRSAMMYSEVLGEQRLDCILLGMGDDGHTASLFPSTPHLQEESRAVIATRGLLPPVNRISLSLRTINAARQVAFLILGEHKAGPLAHVMDQRGRADAALPAAMVNPVSGALYWFLDHAAASQ